MIGLFKELLRLNRFAKSIVQNVLSINEKSTEIFPIHNGINQYSCNLNLKRYAKILKFIVPV